MPAWAALQLKVQPSSLWNSRKTFYKTFLTSCCPRLYLTSYQHIELDKLHPILYLRARIRRETVALLTAGGGRGIVIGRFVVVMVLLLLLLLSILGGSGGWRIRRKSRVAGGSEKNASFRSVFVMLKVRSLIFRANRESQV